MPHPQPELEIPLRRSPEQRLPEVSGDQVREELTASRRELEKQLGHPVTLLAYPYNSVRGDVQRLAAEAGYRVAVAGPVHGGSGLLNLARIPVKSHTSVEDLKYKLAAH